MNARLLILLSAVVLGACHAQSTTRGYSEQQIKQGKLVFENNCQVCHGVEGQGVVKEWQKVDENGKFPAPPLNGTAHTWHHNLNVLRGTINRGGIPLGGTMPSFKTVLSEEDKTAVLAYILNLWPDEVYDVWKENNG